MLFRVSSNRIIKRMGEACVSAVGVPHWPFYLLTGLPTSFPGAGAGEVYKYPGRCCSGLRKAGAGGEAYIPVVGVFLPGGLFRA